MLLSATPADGSDMYWADPIALEFSEPMEPRSFSAENVKLLVDGVPFRFSFSTTDDAALVYISVVDDVEGVGSFGGLVELTINGAKSASGRELGEPVQLSWNLPAWVTTQIDLGANPRQLAMAPFAIPDESGAPRTLQDHGYAFAAAIDTGTGRTVAVGAMVGGKLIELGELGAADAREPAIFFASNRGWLAVVWVEGDAVAPVLRAALWDGFDWVDLDSPGAGEHPAFPTSGENSTVVTPVLTWNAGGAIRSRALSNSDFTWSDYAPDIALAAAPVDGPVVQAASLGYLGFVEDPANPTLRSFLHQNGAWREMTPMALPVTNAESPRISMKPITSSGRRMTARSFDGSTWNARAFGTTSSAPLFQGGVLEHDAAANALDSELVSFSKSIVPIVVELAFTSQELGGVYRGVARTFDFDLGQWATIADWSPASTGEILEMKAALAPNGRRMPAVLWTAQATNGISLYIARLNGPFVP